MDGDIDDRDKEMVRYVLDTALLLCRATMTKSILRKPLIRACIGFQWLSPFSSWWGAWQQAVGQAWGWSSS